MNSPVTFITPAAAHAALDIALDARAAALAPKPDPKDREGSWCLLAYYGGVLMTMQYYSTPRIAMGHAKEVGRWIEQSATEWRSDCGRWLVRA